MSTRKIVATLLGIAVALGPELAAQRRTFEAVTVTRNTSGEARSSLRLMPDGGVQAMNMTLREVLQRAYQRHAFDRRQVEGGPAWLDTDRFDIVAEATGGHEFGADSFPGQTWLMLRSLLEDRFKLKVRNESRLSPVYELRLSSVSGDPGPRLRRVEVDCGALMAAKTKQESPTELQAGRPVCAVATYPGRLVADALTLRALAGVLSGMLDRAVIDRTGLAGSFEVELEAVEIKAVGPVGPSNRPSKTTQSIFQALPEQLGLKLDATTGPVEVVVIESAEHPAPDKQRP